MPSPSSASNDSGGPVLACRIYFASPRTAALAIANEGWPGSYEFLSLRRSPSGSVFAVWGAVDLHHEPVESFSAISFFHRGAADSKFTQQELPSCKLNLTPGRVITTFAFIGIVFIPIGLAALFASQRERVF